MLRCLVALMLSFSFLVVAYGAEPASSDKPSASADWKPIPRRLPPAGKALTKEAAAKLQAELDRLKKEFEAVKEHNLAADAEIYLKAVEYALKFDEFYSPKDIPKAEAALKTAAQRIADLKAGKSPWTTQTGLVVRGYYSRIDGSPQPYGVVIPKDYDFDKEGQPLYVFLHGRGDQETDLHFIAQREKNAGDIRPANAIVVHPFGRQCIGFKSAGETDVLLAVFECKRAYKCDGNRIVLTGFSMGGAGAWLLGSHYSWLWAAVSPGAGFAETARYQRLDPAKVVWYERVLWGHNDAPNYVRNLFNTVVVAYSGEDDKQIQAANVMAEAYASEGQKLKHLIGPKTGHKYEPNTLKQLMEQLKAAEDRRFPLQFPKLILQTRSLRYNEAYWGKLLGMEEQYQDTRVDFHRVDKLTLNVTTRNATELALEVGSLVKGATLTIDGQKLHIDLESFPSELVVVKRDGKWAAASTAGVNEQRKKPKLSGPIDDAFYDPFVVVLPTGKSKNPQVQKWVDFELAHFKDRWEATFRGRVRTVRDVDVTDELAKENHLLLWGDPSSNAYLAKVIGKLPVVWNESELTLAGEKWDAKNHLPVMIYPNPLSPGQYVVINSGPTFREAHDGTNSQQNPKLPDWAVLNISEQPTDKAAGKVVDADFFDSHWKVRPMHADRKGVLGK